MGYFWLKIAVGLHIDCFFTTLLYDIDIIKKIANKQHFGAYICLKHYSLFYNCIYTKSPSKENSTYIQQSGTFSSKKNLKKILFKIAE